MVTKKGGMRRYEIMKGLQNIFNKAPDGETCPGERRIIELRKSHPAWGQEEIKAPLVNLPFLQRQ